LDTAEDNLNSARVNKDEGLYAWACYIAQQAAETALKAYIIYQGNDLPRTHFTKRLLESCAEYDPDFAADVARLKDLDNFYIPTRYPNGLNDGTPAEFYVEEDADKAIRLASEIVNLVKKKTTD